MAEKDTGIQGYCDGVFWERNTLAEQTRGNRSGLLREERATLFAEDVREGRILQKNRGRMVRVRQNDY